MKIKSNLLALPIILGVSSLAGCGGDKGDGALHIEFWHTFGDRPETALQEKANAFEGLVLQNEGVKVKVDLVYQGAYKDVPRKVGNGVRDGELPSMVVAYADHVANYMDLEGDDVGKYVVNLDDFINNEELKFGTDTYLGDTKDVDDIIPSYLDEGKHMTREGTYLLPYMKSTEIMIYNLDAAQDIVPIVFEGIQTTQVETFMKTITWDQLMQIAKYAVEHKTSFPGLEYPVYYDSDSNLFITELFQRGIGYSSIDSSGSGVIDFETGENLTNAKAMVTELKEAHTKGYLTTKGTEGTYASNNFKEGKTLFSIGSTGGTGYTIPSAGEFSVGFARVPVMTSEVSRQKWISQGPSICFLNNPALSQEDNANKLKYSWKFAKYITSTEINTLLCVDGSEGYSPVRSSCYETETYFEFADCGTSYAAAAKVTQDDISGKYFNSAVFPGSATLREQVGGIITSVFSNKASIDAAFSAAITNTKKDIK